MIIRIFKVRIQPELREPFERDFNTVSVPHVEGQKGLVSLTVGTPTSLSPDDYLLITEWATEEALQEFAGTEWTKAVIPDGMEKYVVDCWVDHYENATAT